MEDVIDTEDIDKDSVNTESLSQLFVKKCSILTEQTVSVDRSYIKKLHATNSLKVTVCLSDNNIGVYELNSTSLSKLCHLSGHKKGLSEAVFSPKADHLIYSAGEDGLLKLWDTRASGTCVLEYKDDSEELTRPYECMDVSCNGQILCAGSQLVEGDAYLIFWDQRQTKPLGGYWNSHTDDITQVKFHKEKTQILASGALDGLLNVFNIMELSEDDALTYSLNIGRSVDKLTWLDEKKIACNTECNDFQLWDADSGDLIKNYAREKITKCIKRTKADDCYLVDTFMCDQTPVLLAGSYSNQGDVLRSLSLTEKKLEPHTNFMENKQVVRCCWYHKERGLLLTGGESGMISVWRWEDGGGASGPVCNKITGPMKKLHVNRHKPY